MVIAIFGESCAGKSTLAEKVKPLLDAEVFSGKDYLRLAKNEADARKIFQSKLAEGGNILYVISDQADLSLLPENALRILVTAELDTIKARFAKRTGGTLPAPVAAMLERKHGTFDALPHDLHYHSDTDDAEIFCAEVVKSVNR